MGTHRQLQILQGIHKGVVVAAGDERLDLVRVPVHPCGLQGRNVTAYADTALQHANVNGARDGLALNTPPPAIRCSFDSTLGLLTSALPLYQGFVTVSLSVQRAHRLIYILPVCLAIQPAVRVRRSSMTRA